jgi:putative two-component system response regulator
METVEAMGLVVDSAVREPGRSLRIRDLAIELARLAGVDGADEQAVGVAATLLDIGHLGVPRRITEKPAILSIDEMEIMRRHPGWGARLLEQIPGFGEIAHWVECHHERPDGRGYPEMLEGRDVPFASRILAVADTYWALRANRPHRGALTHEEALDLIADEGGKQFDPGLAALLPRAMQNLIEAEREAVA